MSSLEYLNCVFCGKNTYLSSIPLDSFDRFSADLKILQVREALPGPGRGGKIKGVGGFVVDPVRSMPIARIVESQEHRDFALAVKDRILKIVGEYLRVGVITRGEIIELTRG